MNSRLQGNERTMGRIVVHVAWDNMDNALKFMWQNEGSHKNQAAELVPCVYRTGTYFRGVQILLYLRMNSRPQKLILAKICPGWCIEVLYGYGVWLGSVCL